eukprot:6461748-Prymnesium_polylepis.1
MATKAHGTLVLIIEKEHASWNLMATALPALELRFWRQLHIASACTAPRGPVGPMHQNGGSCVCRADQWLAIGLNIVQWAIEVCLAASGHACPGFGCRLASYGAPMALW